MIERPRVLGTSACELRDAVRSNFCPRDIFVDEELGRGGLVGKVTQSGEADKKEGQT